jgi:hypothetical protein
MTTKIDIRIIRVETDWVLGLYAEGEKEPYHYKIYGHKRLLLIDLGRVLEELEAIEMQVFPVDIRDLLDFKKED